MKNFLNIVVRIILVLTVSIAGICFLPDGKKKLEYLAFRYLGLDVSYLTNTEETAPETIDTDKNIQNNDEKEIKKNEDINSETSQTPQQMEVNDNATTTLHKNRRAVNNLIGENYLDAILSSGKLERWNPRSFPLKVYINAGSNVPPEYVNEVKNAFLTWQETSHNVITFTYTQNISNADFVCNFTSDLKNRNCDEKGMGAAAYQYFEYNNEGNISHSIVEFSPQMCDGRLFPHNMFYSTALHEIGHGLGLRGHSTNSNDLMFPISSTNERIKISKADLNTLRAVYSIIPDVTNIPFNDEDKKKLVTTDDIWGDSVDRADFTIAQIRKNIALTPNQPALYVELAAALKNKKDYNGALQAYQQALKCVDNQENADAILFEAAQLYLKIGQSHSAQKCLDKVASRTNDTNNDLAGMYMNLAVLHGQKKEYTDAKFLLDKSIMYADNEELKQMIYKNFLWIAYQQKDKILYDKYICMVKK